MFSRRYSKDLDILTAVIAQLAVGKFSQRTPNGLSRDTSISESEIERVLVEYKSLFRVASKPKKNTTECPYSLHLRYALQYETDDDDIEKIKPPLEKDQISSLIEFVSKRASEESSRNLQTATLIISAITLMVSCIALYAKIHS